VRLHKEVRCSSKEVTMRLHDKEATMALHDKEATIALQGEAEEGIEAVEAEVEGIEEGSEEDEEAV